MSSSSSFKPNPLSLSVPDPALDRWLRDSGYLDVLDSSASVSTASTARASPANPTSSSSGAAADVLAFARTLASLLALNPFARLSAADLAAPTPSWSHAFLGPPGAASYSWPPTPTQARLRVQENVRRYARNYAALSILVFACCLYRMPMALLGMLASLAVWEGVRYCRERWGLATRAPGVGQAILHCAQITAGGKTGGRVGRASHGRRLQPRAAGGVPGRRPRAAAAPGGGSRRRPRAAVPERRRLAAASGEDSRRRPQVMTTVPGGGDWWRRLWIAGSGGGGGHRSGSGGGIRRQLDLGEAAGGEVARARSRAAPRRRREAGSRGRRGATRPDPAAGLKEVEQRRCVGGKAESRKGRECSGWRRRRPGQKP